MKSVLFGVAASIFAVVSLAPRAQAEYKFRWINCGQLPGPCDSSGAGGINNAGYVAGTSFLTCPPNYTRGAWIWSPETRALSPLTEPTCTIGNAAQLINDGGSIVGAVECPRGEFDWWFRSPAGEIRWLDPVAGEVALVPTVMNNRDEVVGRFLNPNGGRAGGFYWSPQTGMMRLNERVGGTERFWAVGINDNGWILGLGDVSPRWWLWTPEDGLLDFAALAGIDSSSIGDLAGLNNSGQVVGYGWDVARQEYNTFVWTPESGTRWLPLLFDDWEEYELSTPYLMNDQGVVIGRFESLNYYSHWIWDERRGIRPFGVDSIDPCTDLSLQGIMWYTQMNSRGQILCYAQRNFGGADWRGRAVILDPYLPGDLDPIGGGGGTYPGDGDVDLQDLAILLSNFGRSGDSTYATGDLDCDRDTDLEDLGMLLGNFGETLP